VSAPPPAKKTAGQIEKETEFDVRCWTFDVRRSICLLFNPGLPGLGDWIQYVALEKNTQCR
jgi:hypothetical protein